jgi:hypothetical protein
MRALLLAAALALPLGGCGPWWAALPLASKLAIVGAGVAGATFTVTTIHDCKQDGGCKDVPLLP